MGLAVAILAVRGAVKIKKGEKQDSNYGLEGMCLGMCFGTAGRTRTNEKERKHDAPYL